MLASPDSSTLDSKVMTLWQLYADNQQVATSLRDVESMRSSAINLGIAASIAAFGLNEVARLTLRSRKYHPLLLIRPSSCMMSPDQTRPAYNLAYYLIQPFSS